MFQFHPVDGKGEGKLQQFCQQFSEGFFKVKSIEIWCIFLTATCKSMQIRERVNSPPSTLQRTATSSQWLLEDGISLLDPLQIWTWIQLAHVRPSSWLAAPWSISNSFLSCPSSKAKRWQCNGLFHPGVSQWCYNTHIFWAGTHRAPWDSKPNLCLSSYW